MLVQVEGKQLYNFIVIRQWFISLAVQECRILTYPVNLPGTHDSVVKSVGDVEDISFPEAHLSFVWLVVVKVRPVTGKRF